MKIELRKFQDDAAEAVALLLDDAVAAYLRNGRRQAVALTATTGAGKTVIATAVIEHILFGTDTIPTPPDPTAVFLWITDNPQLNTQTRRRMMWASGLLGSDRLVEVKNTFDQPILKAGRVYFVNTQLLGVKSALSQGHSPKRATSFWETVANTIENERNDTTLYLVIDEAHRGMAEGKDASDAYSIVQRFIKGTDGMPAVPIVLGITATPERFDLVIAGSNRSTNRYEVAPKDVRASGLIKERIEATVAGEAQHDEGAVLRRAVKAWKNSTEWWADYYDKYSGKGPEDDVLVVPILIVQVENVDKGGAATQTDLGAVIRVITETVGPLPDEAYVHSLGVQKDIQVGQRTIRYVEASRISEDAEARVVFFKTGLGTGWDCPRAEVLFSFRHSTDATTIAQTIGRMVRTPLTRSIEEDERLNAVQVYLPHYDKGAVKKIVEYLHKSGDSAVADGIVLSDTRIDLPLRAGAEKIVAAIEALPSYEVPAVRERQEVLRLVSLALQLSKDGIDPGAHTRETQDLASALVAKRDALANQPAFAKAVRAHGEIDLATFAVATGDAKASDPSLSSEAASDEAIAMVFAKAKRTLGEVAVVYAKTRVKADPSSADTARLEAHELSVRSDVMRGLNDLAADRISALVKEHGAAIEALPSARRPTYERIFRQAPDPFLLAIHLPDNADFPRGETGYERHLYADESGNAPLKFTSSWETATLEDRLEDPTVVAWLRNEPRKKWSLCLRRRENNGWGKVYPDFLFVRQVGADLRVDIVDPHDQTKPDALSKAKALAEYAKAHGTKVGAVDLIAKVGNRFVTLHLQDERTRKKVEQADSIGTLNLIFSEA